METRVLHSVFEEGITIREFDDFFKSCWSDNLSKREGKAKEGQFYLVGGHTHKGYHFNLVLIYDKDNLEKAQPDCITGDFTVPNHTLTFIIERRDNAFIYMIRRKNGTLKQIAKADRAYDLLPEAIASGHWIKRGPFERTRELSVP